MRLQSGGCWPASTRESRWRRKEARVLVTWTGRSPRSYCATIVLEPLLTKGPAFHHCCFGFECPPSAVGGQAASKGTSLQVISANQLFSRDNPPSGPSLVWLQTRENPNLPKRSRAHAHAHLVRSDPPPAAEWTRWRSLDQSGARSLARSIEFCFPFLARLVQRAISAGSARRAAHHDSKGLLGAIATALPISYRVCV